MRSAREKREYRKPGLQLRRDAKPFAALSKIDPRGRIKIESFSRHDDHVVIEDEANAIRISSRSGCKVRFLQILFANFLFFFFLFYGRCIILLLIFSDLELLLEIADLLARDAYISTTIPNTNFSAHIISFL